jgi:hypothetical protein
LGGAGFTVATLLRWVAQSREVLGMKDQPSPEPYVAAFERLVTQMKHLRDNCRDALDVNYATKCLDDAYADYKQACYDLIP